MSNDLVLERIADCAVLIFNRPEIRNPLSVSVQIELLEILSELTGDKSLQKIVFTGRDDVFASGANLREIAALRTEDVKAFAERGQRLMNTIAESKIQTIAAVNGFCFGGALDLAMSCHARIAAPTASFCHPGAKLGIMTGWGGTQRLPRLVGEGIALEMLFTAKVVGAAEAKRIGLINEISPDPLNYALYEM